MKKKLWIAVSTKWRDGYHATSQAYCSKAEVVKSVDGMNEFEVVEIELDIPDQKIEITRAQFDEAWINWATPGASTNRRDELAAQLGFK